MVHARPEGAPTARRIVVFADDEPALRRAMSQLLALEGWEVVAAADGAEAVAAVERAAGAVAAVVLDLGMPNVSGREALARLRALAPDVPVLVATGDPGEAAPPGAAALLLKPYGAGELDAALRAALAR